LGVPSAQRKAQFEVINSKVRYLFFSGTSEPTIADIDLLVKDYILKSEEYNGGIQVFRRGLAS